MSTGQLNKSESLPAPKPIIKDYLVKWSNIAPDAEGLIRVKTEFRCDVNLVDNLLLTLPAGEREFVCITDEEEKKRIALRIQQLKAELHSLENNTKFAVGSVYDDGDDAMMEGSEDEVSIDELEDFDYSLGGTRPRRNYDYFETITYYNKDGKGRKDSFYDKEETRRFSVRNLTITGILDDCDDITVSKDQNGKTTLHKGDTLIGSQG